ncbi:uncharacterized protein IL334_005491 [Kwoniella shivajii]|uniref:THUMP domain-containing protein n=1 Tax=Kwoniella shivajii TaxID=564305 RepID=A0ABZ1D3A3_9TREE|nr:hypothetical protein IL334_005491 [Kwoniella shivajii]
MSDRPGPNAEKRKAGGPSSQKHKFYKFQGQARGGRGGRGRGGGGRGRGGGGGDRSDRGDRSPRADGQLKLNPLGKYRIKPIPEILSEPGICVTTVLNKERSAEAELIEYLERVADELYPETAEDDLGADEDEELDFEAALKKDLASMDQSNKSKRFQLCSHDMICVIYINVLPPLSPHRLVRHILEQAESSARSHLKWCKRIIPIIGTSGATIKQLSEMTATVVKDQFHTEDDRALKFAIDTNTRQSDRLDRMDMIHTVAGEITKLDKGHSVDLKNPDKTVLLELYKNTIGLTVVEDYERFKKYNPGAVASSAAQSQSRIAFARDGPESTDPPATESKEASNESTKTPKHVYRQRRAEAISSFNEKSHSLVASDEIVGQDQLEADAEVGEVVENPSGLLGEDWEERIVDGKVERARKDGQ